MVKKNAIIQISSSPLLKIIQSMEAFNSIILMAMPHGETGQW